MGRPRRASTRAGRGWPLPGRETSGSVQAWCLLNALSRDLHQHGKPAPAGLREPDAKRHRRAGLALAPARQCLEGFRDLADESLNRRPIPQARMRPVDCIVGKGTRETALKIREIEWRNRSRSQFPEEGDPRLFEASLEQWPKVKVILQTGGVSEGLADRGESEGGEGSAATRSSQRDGKRGRVAQGSPRGVYSTGIQSNATVPSRPSAAMSLSPVRKS